MLSTNFTSLEPQSLLPSVRRRNTMATGTLGGGGGGHELTRRMQIHAWLDGDQPRIKIFSKSKRDSTADRAHTHRSAEPSTSGRN